MSLVPYDQQEMFYRDESLHIPSLQFPGITWDVFKSAYDFGTLILNAWGYSRDDSTTVHTDFYQFNWSGEREINEKYAFNELWKCLSVGVSQCVYGQQLTH